MKKYSAMLLSLLLVLCLASPVSAEQTTVTYTVSENYSVKIPASGIAITGTSATQNIGINANSLIASNKQIEIHITSDNCDATGHFFMRNQTDSTILLGYTISADSDPDIIKSEVFLTLSAAQCYEGAGVDLTFTPDTTASRAGTYSDTITFVFSVDNVSD